jgi:hypothetical protein
MISEKDKTNIRNGAEDVWNDIGHDILEALELEKELDPNYDKSKPSILTQKDVIELVLDAGRLNGYLKEQDQWMPEMKNLSLNEWIELVKPAFPFSVYGK